MSVGFYAIEYGKAIALQTGKEEQSYMKKKAFKAALPYTLPICVGFLFLGMSYGFLMRSMGSPCWINIKMSDGKSFI